jgi:hypothetical protein
MHLAGYENLTELYSTNFNADIETEMQIQGQDYLANDVKDIKEDDDDNGTIQLTYENIEICKITYCACDQVHYQLHVNQIMLSRINGSLLKISSEEYNYRDPANSAELLDTFMSVLFIARLNLIGYPTIIDYTIYAYQPFHQQLLSINFAGLAPVLKLYSKYEMARFFFDYPFQKELDKYDLTRKFVLEKPTNWKFGNMVQTSIYFEDNGEIQKQMAIKTIKTIAPSIHKHPIGAFLRKTYERIAYNLIITEYEGEKPTIIQRGGNITRALDSGYACYMINLIMDEQDEERRKKYLKGYKTTPYLSYCYCIGGQMTQKHMCPNIQQYRRSNHCGGPEIYLDVDSAYYSGMSRTPEYAHEWFIIAHTFPKNIHAGVFNKMEGKWMREDGVIYMEVPGNGKTYRHKDVRVYETPIYSDDDDIVYIHRNNKTVIVSRTEYSYETSDCTRYSIYRVRTTNIIVNPVPKMKLPIPTETEIQGSPEKIETLFNTSGSYFYMTSPTAGLYNINGTYWITTFDNTQKLRTGIMNYTRNVPTEQLREVFAMTPIHLTETTEVSLTKTLCTTKFKYNLLEASLLSKIACSWMTERKAESKMNHSKLYTQTTSTFDDTIISARKIMQDFRQENSYKYKEIIQEVKDTYNVLLDRVDKTVVHIEDTVAQTITNYTTCDYLRWPTKYLKYTPAIFTLIAYWLAYVMIYMVTVFSSNIRSLSKIPYVGKMIVQRTRQTLIRNIEVSRSRYIRGLIQFMAILTKLSLELCHYLGYIERYELFILNILVDILNTTITIYMLLYKKRAYDVMWLVFMIAINVFLKYVMREHLCIVIIIIFLLSGHRTDYAVIFALTMFTRMSLVRTVRYNDPITVIPTCTANNVAEMIQGMIENGIWETLKLKEEFQKDHSRLLNCDNNNDDVMKQKSVLITGFDVPNIPAKIHRCPRCAVESLARQLMSNGLKPCPNKVQHLKERYGKSEKFRELYQAMTQYEFKPWTWIDKYSGQQAERYRQALDEYRDAKTKYNNYRVEASKMKQHTKTDEKIMILYNEMKMKARAVTQQSNICKVLMGPVTAYITYCRKMAGNESFGSGLTNEARCEKFQRWMEKGYDAFLPLDGSAFDSTQSAEIQEAIDHQDYQAFFDLHGAEYSDYADVKDAYEVCMETTLDITCMLGSYRVEGSIPSGTMKTSDGNTNRSGEYVREIFDYMGEEVKLKPSGWDQRIVKYGFLEGIDYNVETCGDDVLLFTFKTFSELFVKMAYKHVYEKDCKQFERRQTSTLGQIAKMMTFHDRLEDCDYLSCDIVIDSTTGLIKMYRKLERFFQMTPFTISNQKNQVRQENELNSLLAYADAYSTHLSHYDIPFISEYCEHVMTLGHKPTTGREIELVQKTYKPDSYTSKVDFRGTNVYHDVMYNLEKKFGITYSDLDEFKVAIKKNDNLYAKIQCAFIDKLHMNPGKQKANEVYDKITSKMQHQQIQIKNGKRCVFERVNKFDSFEYNALDANITLFKGKQKSKFEDKRRKQDRLINGHTLA